MGHKINISGSNKRVREEENNDKAVQVKRNDSAMKIKVKRRKKKKKKRKSLVKITNCKENVVLTKMANRGGGFFY